MKSTPNVARAARALFPLSQARALGPRPISSIRASLSRPSKSYLEPCASLYPTRTFSTTLRQQRGLQPDTDEPKAPNPAAHHTTSHAAQPAHIGEEEYHVIADAYIDTLLHTLEEVAEDSAKGLEVEYSAGVLTLNTPSGTYVINKQPPNKQIWLSSPISGPFRYDWVISGDSMHQKEGTETHDEGAGGKWTYLRDGGTLSELLERELGIEIVGEEPEQRGEVYSGSE